MFIFSCVDSEDIDLATPGKRFDREDLKVSFMQLEFSFVSPL